MIHIRSVLNRLITASILMQFLWIAVMPTATSSQVNSFRYSNVANISFEPQSNQCSISLDNPKMNAIYLWHSNTSQCFKLVELLKSMSHRTYCADAMKAPETVWFLFSFSSTILILIQFNVPQIIQLWLFPSNSKMIYCIGVFITKIQFDIVFPVRPHLAS